MRPKNAFFQTNPCCPESLASAGATAGYGDGHTAAGRGMGRRAETGTRPERPRCLCGLSGGLTDLSDQEGRSAGWGPFL